MDYKEKKELALSSLCIYNIRNPNNIVGDLLETGTSLNEIIKMQENCSCDNCFYGRNELSLIILETLDKEMISCKI